MTSQEDLLRIIEEFKRKEEESEKEKEELKEKFKQEKEALQLHKQGLPQPPTQVRSEPSGTTQNNHEKAVCKKGSFRILTEALDENNDSSLTWTYRNKKKRNVFGSENAIQYLVSNVLMDCVSLASLEDKIDIHSELGSFGGRPDLYIVTHMGVPIGVVEVKRPHENILDNDLVHGQLYDYMLRLKTFFGITNVFGIASTYESWRIVWLPDADADECANSSAVDKNFTRNDEIEKEPHVETEGGGSIEAQIPQDKQERMLHGTRIILWNDKELIPMLCSVIQKMYYSKNVPVKRISSKRPYIVLSREKWLWKYIKWSKNFQLDYKRMPESCDSFILLEDLRGGAEGRVWLACTERGEMCAIKFYHENDKKGLREECSNFNKTNSPNGIQKAFLTILNEIEALVMPFGFPIENASQNEEVLKAINDLAQRKICHKDIRPRHCCWRSPVKTGSSRQIMFIDTRNIEEEMDPLQAKMKMLQLLNEK